MQQLYFKHIAIRQQHLAAALAAEKFDALVISAGHHMVYFADDREAPFVPTPHFAHWCPDEGPSSLLFLEAGKKPRLLLYRPADFWYESADISNAYWTSAFDITTIETEEKIWSALAGVARGRVAFIGADTQKAEERGLWANPAPLVARLDWDRGIKTSYELHLIHEANKVAALGHKAVRDCYLAGPCSERELHYTFLQATQQCEAELPYGSIIGFGEKAAVLHYQQKRRDKSRAPTLLIDAGCRVQGYASDITRTYARSEALPAFHKLLEGMEKLQQQLVAAVAPGVPFVNLHEKAHLLITQLLLDTGVLRGCSAEEGLAQGLSLPFYPHGLGHMLGLQVHDVSGTQKDESGAACEASEKFPRLRTRRPLRLGEVVTIEPGLYFIPMLLAQHRQGQHKERFEWALIDKLIPLGGIRIEDNVYVGEEGPENLTRPYLP